MTAHRDFLVSLDSAKAGMLTISRQERWWRVKGRTRMDTGPMPVPI